MKPDPYMKGVILLEVLLAVGLLGLVATCLLSAFHQARRVETELRSTLAEVDAVNRIAQLLQDDLLETRALVNEETDDPRDRTINLLRSGDGSRVRYQWDASDETFRRVVEVGDESALQLDLWRKESVAIEILSAFPGEEIDSVATALGPVAAALRVQMVPTSDGTVAWPATPTREFLVALPVRIPVLGEGEVRP